MPELNPDLSPNDIGTVDVLIRMHRATLADIAHGKKFSREGKDVTREIMLRCRREVQQCQQVKEALQHMGAGELSRATDLLREIKEYLPGGYQKN